MLTELASLHYQYADVNIGTCVFKNKCWV